MTNRGIIRADLDGTNAEVVVDGTGIGTNQISEYYRGNTLARNRWFGRQDVLDGLQNQNGLSG